MERGLFSGVKRREIVAKLTPQMEAAELLSLQQQVKQVFVSPTLPDYVQAILRHTRESARYVHGLSPRAGLSLLAAARTWALLDGRSAVIPEDVQDVQTSNGDILTRELIEAVPIP